MVESEVTIGGFLMPRKYEKVRELMTIIKKTCRFFMYFAVLYDYDSRMNAPPRDRCLWQ